MSYFFYSESKNRRSPYFTRKIQKNGYSLNWPQDFEAWLQLGQFADDQIFMYRRSLLAEFFRVAVITQSRRTERHHRIFDDFTGQDCYKLNATHLEMAKAELTKIRVIGLQERLDESMVWASIELGWQAKELVYSRKVIQL